MRLVITLFLAASCLCAAPDARAAYKVLHSFEGGNADGAHPRDDLLLKEGYLYGMTYGGGKFDGGVLFRVDPDGNYAALWHFGNPDNDVRDGKNPRGSLIESGGVLYGMTSAGGWNGKGLLFSWALDGTKYNYMWDFGEFDGDGEKPVGSPVIIGDTLYGMTSMGDGEDGGVIFSINRNGHHASYKILHEFTGGPDDGRGPRGGLLAEEGRLFGMTEQGGAYAMDAGTIFSINPDGSGFTVLHSFSGDDGLDPQGSLVSDGERLYGMDIVTPGPMALRRQALIGPVPWGTMGKVFSIKPDGSGFTILHSLEGGVDDGGMPFGSPLLADGALYGMTTTGGGDEIGPGVIFSVRTDGSGFTLLHVFDGLLEGTGTQPHGGLVSNGTTLYGMTYCGGTEGEGAIFSLDIPDPSPRPGTSLRMTLNDDSLVAGDLLTVDVDVEPLAQSFDAWAVLLGTNRSYSMVLGQPGEVRSGTHPLVTGVGGLEGAYSGRLLDLVIPPGAAGTYRVIVGLVPAGVVPTGPESCIAGYVDEKIVTIR